VDLKLRIVKKIATTKWQIPSNISLKSCGIAIAKVIPSSCGIAIDKKKVARAHLLAR
jgi:hypothetical protein